MGIHCSASWQKQWLGYCEDITEGNLKNKILRKLEADSKVRLVEMCLSGLVY